MTDKRANVVTLDDNRDKITNLQTETSPFTKKQLEILQKLFSQNSLPQSSTSASGSGFGLLA
jgi:UDP-glucose 6-dehydrogenase